MAAAVPAPASPPSPAPAPSLLRRLAAAPWVASTYFAEGLPFSIVRQLSSEFFTSLGASPEAIGATSLYGLAWNLKLLWSPLVDRHGTMRRWLLVVEALLGLVVMGVAWPGGAAGSRGVARLLVVVAFLAATHDIAIDGFYLEALDKGSQAMFAGLRVAAYKCGAGRRQAAPGAGGRAPARGLGPPGRLARHLRRGAGAALVVLAGAHALDPAASARRARARRGAGAALRRRVHQLPPAAPGERPRWPSSCSTRRATR